MSWHLQTIGESVAEELGRFGGGGTIAAVTAAWPVAVGSAIAENAWPARCARDGTLTVTTSSSVWAFELTKLEGDVRRRLADHLGPDAPARIRFVPGRLPERGSAETVTNACQNVRELTNRERRAGEEIAAPVENEELRVAVARAAAAALARRRGVTDDRTLW